MINSRCNAPYLAGGEGVLEVEGLPEGLKNSLRRPAASLLRLATLSDFRPSNERLTASIALTFRQVTNPRISHRKSRAS